MRATVRDWAVPALVGGGVVAFLWVGAPALIQAAVIALIRFFVVGG